MDNSELLHMLEVPESLKSKVEEAVSVLRDHQMKEQDQPVHVTRHVSHMTCNVYYFLLDNDHMASHMISPSKYLLPMIT